MYRLYINCIIILFLVLCISFINLKKEYIYPKYIFDIWYEPLGRYVLYLFVYLISFYNELISLLLIFILVLIHIDIDKFIRLPVQ